MHNKGAYTLINIMMLFHRNMFASNKIKCYEALFGCILSRNRKIQSKMEGNERRDMQVLCSYFINIDKLKSLHR